MGQGKDELRPWLLGRAAWRRRGLRRGDFVRPCVTVSGYGCAPACGAYHGGAGNDKNGAGGSAPLPPAAALRGRGGLSRGTSPRLGPLPLPGHFCSENGEVFPFMATSAGNMGMLLPFMAIYALNLGRFTLHCQFCSKPGAAFASSSRFPPGYECLVPFRARLVPNMRILSPFNSFVFAKSGDAFPFRTIFALSLGTVCP